MDRERKDMLEILFDFEGEILLFIQKYIRNSVLNPIITFITSLGDEGRIWIGATLGLLMFKKTRKIGIMSAVALFSSLFINNLIIKNVVARPRPYTAVKNLSILIPRPSDYSFPSGHTASSFAAATVFFRNLPKKWGTLAIVLAGLIGFSRMYLGVHYPTDVLAGATIGVLLARMAEYIVKKECDSAKKE